MALKPTQGFWPVVFALGGNLFVTAIKFIAASLSGSSAMFSEAIHTLADTVNQALLLIGLGRSTKRPDESFEYGYGNERFFWALISACGVFFVGAGLTGYSGLSALHAPHTLEFTATVTIVLALSFSIELYTFLIAESSLRRDFPDTTLSERLALADPATLAVFLEDAVALVGIVVAAAALLLSYYTGSATWDALGSVAISALLALVALTLIIRNRAYLIGRALPEERQGEIIEQLLSEPAIEKVIDFKSVSVAFGTYRIKCEVEFNGSALLRDEHPDALREQYDDVHDDFDAFKRFYADYADRIPRLVGRSIDDIESRIRARFPEVRHIDIELN